MKTQEKKTVALFRELLKSSSRKKPIKSHIIESKLGISGFNVRRMTHYLRASGKLPIISNDNGYYISYSKKEIKQQIESLEFRAKSISDAANGLLKFLK